MSDKTGVPRPSRSGPGVILSGLAVGAILGAPVAAEPSAAVTEAAVAEAAVTADCAQPDDASASAATAIREQFQASFTAGAVAPLTVDLPTIICDP